MADFERPCVVFDGRTVFFLYNKNNEEYYISAKRETKHTIIELPTDTHRVVKFRNYEKEETMNLQLDNGKVVSIWFDSEINWYKWDFTKVYVFDPEDEVEPQQNIVF